MKHAIFSILAAGLGSMASTQAATTIWNYDFGSGTGVYNTNNSASTSFLPAPPTDGGTARVRVSNNQGGSFSLVNPGSGSQLEILAPTGGSVNKFSIYDFANASTAVSLSYDMTLSGGSSGTWYMFVGDGATYSDNNGFTGAQVFAGLRFAFGASDAITVSNRAGSSWSTLSGTGIAQNTTFNIRMVGNNSSSSITYGSNTLAANTWDMYVDDVFITNLAKGQLANNANIDSFMFYGESSTANVAKITLDNFIYSNTAIPEPSAALLGGLGVLALLRRRR